MPQFNTIFFDLFNTLISVGEVPANVGRFTADILGFDHEEWNRACFSSEHEICRPTRHEDVLATLARTINPDISHELVKEAAEHRQRRFDYALTEAREDVLEVLDTLKQKGVKLALVSNASTAEVAAWPDSPLSRLIEHTFFSCECGFRKPDNNIYRHAIESTTTNASNCLFVGDGGSDELRGAHRAGLKTVHTTQFSAPHRVEKVRQQQGSAIHHEINHIRGVLDLLGDK